MAAAPAARLIFLTGDNKGQIVPLVDGPVTLGRHRKCRVQLKDEHCSRQHAEVYEEEGGWRLRDLASQNGTFVAGRRVETLALSDGDEILIGETRLLFSVIPFGPTKLTEPVEQPDVGDTTAGLLARTPLPRDELSSLCRFMADAVDESDVDRLLSRALEAARLQTGASVVGFLGLDEAGELVQRLVLPETTKVDYHLSRSLTERAEKERRLIWLAGNGAESRSVESIVAFDDALCAPLLVYGHVLGTLHVYRGSGVFGPRDLRFCEVLARHLAGSLWMLRARKNLLAENSRLRQHSALADRILGDSPAMTQLRATIEKAAPHPTLVLIRGESGVGKELVAQALHQSSPRKDGPFVVINCATIPATLMESQLFGHKKGAFSGAEADHAGFFQQADGGTLFLDEIGELPRDCQAKLLRVLDGKGFIPVGATAEIKADVRVVAATNRDIERALKEGEFRRDFYYRLKVVEIVVPPLRDHTEDIPALVEYYLGQIGTRVRRRLQLQPAALERLTQHPWPGNVRQLICVLESAAILADKNVLDAHDLRLGDAPSGEGPRSLKLEDLERWAYAEALKRSAGSVKDAVKLLGVSRDTFYRKAKLFDLKWKE